MTRKEAREQAFFILFEQVIQNKSTQEILEDAADARDLQINTFTKKLAFGAEAHLEELDRLIEENLKGWNMRRISKVTLAVLRLSAYEIYFESDTPLSVAINEAVELAKVYAGEKDAAYVNGVLSSIAKNKESQKETAAIEDAEEAKETAETEQIEGTEKEEIQEASETAEKSEDGQDEEHE
ncbi:transcription antitermination factor NusB [Scatolibacter rhodanostii]|uniref:transcription antitermination factor NusB n=1 Tax=Scatolibacter rhodanostii TaxID=2014781 RepID=UPI0013564C51|nr:transcription antitermination factor NusB [Scatolibacter rhodanostii]